MLGFRWGRKLRIERNFFKVVGVSLWEVGGFFMFSYDFNIVRF